jgi:hypothetical protein
VTWGWSVGKDTRIRKNGSRTTLSALAVGDRVVVFGPVEGTNRTARAVIVPKRTTTASPSAAAS